MKVATCFRVAVALVCALGILTSDAWAIPYCRPCPFDCDELGLEEGGKDCSDRGASGNACCVDLSPKGLDLAEAQDDVNDSDDDDDDVDDEECPDGFEESEDKCTEEEREEGCKDIRLDNGKGCVRR
jgi:hypothetical protein